MIVVCVGGIAVLSITPIGRAIARRIAGTSPDAESQRDARLLREEVEHLRGELELMHGRLTELDELHGRVDFAERLLAQSRDKPALPGARGT